MRDVSRFVASGKRVAGRGQELTGEYQPWSKVNEIVKLPLFLLRPFSPTSVIPVSTICPLPRLPFTVQNTHKYSEFP